MSSIAEIVLPVFFLILLGWIVRTGGLADDHFFRQANGLLFTVCLPALLFDKIGNADFSSSFNPRLVLATSLAVALVFLAGHGIAKFTGCKGSKKIYNNRRLLNQSFNAATPLQSSETPG